MIETRSEKVDRHGKVVRLRQPVKERKQRLFIVHRNGVVYGEGGDQPASELEIEVRLPKIPRPDKTWSARGVKAYRQGARTQPGEAFARLVQVVDRFIDFDRSLADQRSMAELVACYILSTWFLDAFNVIGFLWPNADKGSGKTMLLHVVCELAYLGQVILAGGSFATLRDLADYGASLAFDDAENLGDPHKTDPDKRALLLAGNHRGALTTLKELGADKQWHTRYVNSFCPRLFSAISLPDTVLASRTIITPLVRTTDREKGNVELMDETYWPCDKRKLLDDLWALALERLPELPAVDRWVGRHAPLTGRALQPWRALLAVAKWLEENGVEGVYARMRELALGYQQEKPEMERSDWTVLILRAILRLLSSRIAPEKKRPLQPTLDLEDGQAGEIMMVDQTMKAGATIKTIKTISPEDIWVHLKTNEISEMAIEIARAEDLDLEIEAINSRRVGRLLAKMRFKKNRSGENRAREWIVGLKELEKLARAYGIDENGGVSLQGNGLNGLNGLNGRPNHQGPAGAAEPESLTADDESITPQVASPGSAGEAAVTKSTTGQAQVREAEEALETGEVEYLQGWL